MTPPTPHKPQTWQLHHTDKLHYQATHGAPTLRIKFYHYTPYRQTVHTTNPPKNCTLKTKGLNTYYLYTAQVPTKGTITFERTITITPHPTPPPTDYGHISAIPTDLAKKYRQSHPYWPLDSKPLQHLTDERWFSTDSLQDWLLTIATLIPTIIHTAEPQDKRWGAEKVLQSGIGDCDEFTDLFITLARLRGIPSRRLTGYHIDTTTLTPIPHAWAECYTPTNGWIPIDLALHIIGAHTSSYLIQKIEEFNPDLPDFQIQQQSSYLHVNWERPPPTITPLP
jgi:transglutaminase-like putative cysteine protease